MLDPGPGGPVGVGSTSPNPWVAALSVIGSVIIGVGPYLWGRRSTGPPKPPPGTPPDPAPVVGPPALVPVDIPVATTAQVPEGSTELLLVKMVNNLERRVDKAQALAEQQDAEHQARYEALDLRWQTRYDEAEKRNAKQQRDHYEVLAEVRGLRAEAATLREQVSTLKGQLMGGPR